MKVGGKRKLTIPPTSATARAAPAAKIPAELDARVRGRARRSVKKQDARSSRTFGLRGSSRAWHRSRLRRRACGAVRATRPPRHARATSDAPQPRPTAAATAAADLEPTRARRRSPAPAARRRRRRPRELRRRALARRERRAAEDDRRAARPHPVDGLPSARRVGRAHARASARRREGGPAARAGGRRLRAPRDRVLRRARAPAARGGSLGRFGHGADGPRVRRRGLRARGRARSRTSSRRRSASTSSSAPSDMARAARASRRAPRTRRRSSSSTTTSAFASSSSRALSTALRRHRRPSDGLAASEVLARTPSPRSVATYDAASTALLATRRQLELRSSSRRSGRRRRRSLGASTTPKPFDEALEGARTTPIERASDSSASCRAAARLAHARSRCASLASGRSRGLLTGSRSPGATSGRSRSSPRAALRRARRGRRRSAPRALGLADGPRR